jgi:MtrB/PioB family decaheme-associated outer membrane protein
MRRSLLVILPPAFFCFSAVSAQASDPNINASQWQCKWCPEADRNVESNLEGGVGYVTNDSYKFGDYTGLNEKGAYVLADADARVRGDEGGYLDAEVRNLGLDSRSVDLQGGLQGKVQLRASYDQLPKFITDSAHTPYAGESVQHLPAGWTREANTTNMAAQLTNTLRDITLSTERRTGTIRATYFQNAALSYDILYQHETKKGERSAGLGFGFAGFHSTILPIPVDYETDIAKFGVNYRARRWQAGVDFQFSAFNNKNDSIRWDNAFSTPANAPQGQAAMEPDNSMQKLTARGSYKITDSMMLAALLSYGQMRQDQQYLPYTINTAISPPALPKNSLDGQINTLDAMVNLHAGITKKLKLQFQYDQHEQDNNTDRATYDYVSADTVPAANARSNLPYSFRQRKLEGEAQYRFSKQHRLRAGTDYEIYDRTYQEVDTTNEYRLWGVYQVLVSQLEINVRLDYADRNGDDYKAVSDITPPQDPLMRKYNMADRVRNNAGFSLRYSPLSSLDLGLNTHYAKDDYNNSDVGLQESNETGLSLDARYVIAKALTLSALYSLTNIDSTQAAPTWQAENDDRLDVFDAGLMYKLIADKLDIGFNYTYAKSNGKITVDNSSFPELTTTRHTFRVYSDYNLTGRSYLNVAYLYEEYDEEDWSVDGVTANTINNVLTLGEVSPSYNIGYITVSYRYTF